MQEFRNFVHETEKELLVLFKSIDFNHDNHISRDELQVAFRRAGVVVPNSKLDEFFHRVDANGDGTISFDEWRYVPPSERQDKAAHLQLLLSGWRVGQTLDISFFECILLIYLSAAIFFYLYQPRHRTSMQS